MEYNFLTDTEAQIQKEREEKYAKLDKMSEQEKAIYFQEKSRRVQEYASSIGMRVDTVKSSKLDKEGK